MHQHQRLRVVAVGLAMGLIGGCSTSPAAVDAAPEAAPQAVSEETDGQEAMVSACRAARLMLDANVAAGATAEGGEDPALRARANDARDEFFRAAVEVEDGTFVDLSSRWRVLLAQASANHERFLDGQEAAYPDAYDELLVVSDEVHERCLDAGVEIRGPRSGSP